MSAASDVTALAFRPPSAGGEAYEHSIPAPKITLAALAGELNALLGAARPRLIHLARLQGLAPDVADDVAQEALLTAWRSLDRLRTPERFDAWRDGITRNIGRRYLRARRTEHAQMTPLSHHTPDTEADDASVDEEALITRMA